MAAATDLAAWVEIRRGMLNNWHHEQWCTLAQDESIRRLCILAPREHCKSEVFSVNLPAWKSIYVPGHWTYIFSLTVEQAVEMLDRAVGAMEQAAPDLLYVPRRWSNKDKIFANGARITVRGAGSKVRGAHPDLIVLDDILDNESAGTEYQRAKVRRWFFGTVANMAHPGTKIIVVGTPQHQLDLLMNDLRQNPEYAWIRYQAILEDEYYDLLRGTPDGRIPDEHERRIRSGVTFAPSLC